MKIEGSLLEQFPQAKWSSGWYVVAGFIGVALVIIGAIAWKGEGPLVAIKEASLLLPAVLTTTGFIMAVASCALGLVMTQNAAFEQPQCAEESVADEPPQISIPPTPPPTLQLEKVESKPEPPKKLSNAELENDVRVAAMQTYGIKILKIIEGIKASLPEDIDELRKPHYHFESCLDQKDITKPHFIMGLFTCEKLLRKGFLHLRLEAHATILPKYLSYFSHIAIMEIHCDDFEAYLKRKNELKAIYEGLLTLQIQPKDFTSLKTASDDDELYDKRIAGYFHELCQELGYEPHESSEEIAKKLIQSTKLLEKEFFEGLFYNNLFVPYQIIMKSKELSKVKEVFLIAAKEVLQKERDQSTSVAADIFSTMTQLYEG